MGAQGTADLDFGAAPGATEATVAVTGQGAIVAGSLVEAWLRPVATATHDPDDYLQENLRVIATDIVAGTGFTIYGWTEPVNGAVAPLQGAYKVAWVWN